MTFLQVHLLVVVIVWDYLLSSVRIAHGRRLPLVQAVATLCGLDVRTHGLRVIGGLYLGLLSRGHLLESR